MGLQGPRLALLNIEVVVAVTDTNRIDIHWKYTSNFVDAVLPALKTVDARPVEYTGAAVVGVHSQPGRGGLGHDCC